ncbi:MAG: PAS domain S-box protein [Betaproteobacteria bacterium]|nr:PAS domain S-box protein [Betaproteobacteria bacterium]MDH4322757.1 PAS domain S-box protein [Betaproteobacteria bacterium]
MTPEIDARTELYEMALHAAPSGIVVVDERGGIRFANRTLADMFGYRIEELLGQAVEILLPVEHAATHRRHVEDYTQRPQPRPMGSGRDLEGQHRDGRRFPVEIGLRSAQTASGRAVVATVVDITRRKAIEERLRMHETQLEALVAERTRELRESQLEKERVVEQLIQAEKMTAVGTLVSGIGHEINNPLYTILATAEALAVEPSLAQCHAYGLDILRHVKDIAEIVRNLSRYAQPGSCHDLQRVNVNAAVEGAVRLARRAIRADAVEIRIEAGPVPDILAKAEEVQQVIFNVVRNAVQAIAGSGRVDVRTRADGGWVGVTVQDSGPGITAENLKRVFDPFFTTKGPDEGEGLGLYIVRQIVTRYRGTIGVENAAGGGARFLIRFPGADVVNRAGEHA